MGDGGLGGVDGGAMTFTWWWVLAVYACGGTRVERDVIGDGEAVGGGMGSRGSWLFHTSQCKALQVCSGRARELGAGASVGSSS